MLPGCRSSSVLRPLSSVLARWPSLPFFLLLYLCLSGFPLLGLRASLDPTRSLKPTAIPFFLFPCPVLLWLIWPWLCSPWQVPLELATVFSGAAMEVFYVWNNNSYLNVVQPFLKCHNKFSLKHYFKSISLFLFATHLFCSWLWFWFTTSFLSRHSWSLCFRPNSMTMSWFFVSMSDMNVMESSKLAHTHTRTQSNTHVERFHTKCFRVEEILKWMQDGGEGNVRGRKRGRGGRQARAVYSLLTRQKRFMPATIATTSAIKTATAATNKNVIKIKQKWEVVSASARWPSGLATRQPPGSPPAYRQYPIPASPHPHPRLLIWRLTSPSRALDPQAKMKINGDGRF